MNLIPVPDPPRSTHQHFAQVPPSLTTLPSTHLRQCLRAMLVKACLPRRLTHPTMLPSWTATQCVRIRSPNSSTQSHRHLDMMVPTTTLSPSSWNLSPLMWADIRPLSSVWMLISANKVSTSSSPSTLTRTSAKIPSITHADSRTSLPISYSTKHPNSLSYHHSCRLEWHTCVPTAFLWMGQSRSIAKTFRSLRPPHLLNILLRHTFGVRQSCPSIGTELVEVQVRISLCDVLVASLIRTYINSVLDRYTIMLEISELGGVARSTLPNTLPPKPRFSVAFNFKPPTSSSSSPDCVNTASNHNTPNNHNITAFNYSNASFDQPALTSVFPVSPNGGLSASSSISNISCSSQDSDLGRMSYTWFDPSTSSYAHYPLLGADGTQAHLGNHDQADLSATYVFSHY